MAILLRLELKNPPQNHKDDHTAQTRSNVVGNDSNAIGEPLQFSDRIRLKDVEKTEQNEGSQPVEPAARGHRGKHDPLTDDFVHDNLRRVSAREVIDCDVSRPASRPQKDHSEGSQPHRGKTGRMYQAVADEQSRGRPSRPGRHG